VSAVSQSTNGVAVEAVNHDNIIISLCQSSK